MVIISVDRDELTEITLEGGTSGDHLNVIGRRVVVRVHQKNPPLLNMINFSC